LGVFRFDFIFPQRALFVKLQAAKKQVAPKAPRSVVEISDDDEDEDSGFFDSDNEGDEDDVSFRVH